MVSDQGTERQVRIGGLAVPTKFGSDPKLCSMTSTTTTSRPPLPAAAADPTQFCGDLLREMRDDWQAKGIWRTPLEVVEHLLRRESELAEAYQEICAKLRTAPAVRSFLDALVMTAAFVNPGKIDRARRAKTELDKTNVRIAAVAEELADLLRQRENLHDSSPFSSRTLYHVVDAVDGAASANGLYGAYVQERLDELRSQFDLKYWPSLASVVDAIGTDASLAIAEPTDRIMAAAMGTRRATAAHFLQALFASIRERSRSLGGMLQEGYKPSDGALAALATCALNLGKDELLDGPFVKRVRQRIREAAAKEQV